MRIAPKPSLGKLTVCGAMVNNITRRRRVDLTLTAPDSGRDVSQEALVSIKRRPVYTFPPTFTERRSCMKRSTEKRVAIAFWLVLTVLAIVRLTLAAEARIIAAMTFRSRDDVDALAKVVNEAFSQTELVAADDLNADVYMALLRLHGDITQHLADSGRVLPRVISYKYQMVMPSLRMAQLAYADPTRSSDLEYENAVVHPAFMPLSGRMLAV